jgi:hypothetical protein
VQHHEQGFVVQHHEQGFVALTDRCSASEYAMPAGSELLIEAMLSK